MAYIDDSKIGKNSSIELHRPFGKRRITHVIHDIDGTHSLIRDWPPVMSLSIYWAMTCGLEDDFDSAENLQKLIERVGKEPLPETDSYCVECAGFSALTQLEYGIRRAIELGNLPKGLDLNITPQQRENNSRVIKRILSGQEVNDDIEDAPSVIKLIEDKSPRLFRLYESILNGAGRDRNTADAKNNPAKWRVAGALEFMEHLKKVGCVNYFVTGAVIYAEGGMKEEVEAVGFEVGPGKLVESLRGSSWDKKMPKDDWIKAVVQEENLDPADVLIVGDGRTEIKVGVEMGSVTISRLPKHEKRQREIQIGLGTNLVMLDYTDPDLYHMIY